MSTAIPTLIHRYGMHAICLECGGKLWRTTSTARNWYHDRGQMDCYSKECKK